MELSSAEQKLSEVDRIIEFKEQRQLRLVYKIDFCRSRQSVVSLRCFTGFCSVLFTSDYAGISEDCFYYCMSRDKQDRKGNYINSPGRSDTVQQVVFRYSRYGVQS